MEAPQKYETKGRQATELRKGIEVWGFRVGGAIHPGERKQCLVTDVCPDMQISPSDENVTSGSYGGR